jgi:recombination protein RecA
MAKRNIDDISVALDNLEKGQGNKKGLPKIQVYSEYLGDNKGDVDVIPFGLPHIDSATNIGGVPRGRMIELYGPESGGKSYMSLKLMVSAQKMGILPCLIDVEHSFVPKWGVENGIDLSKMLYGGDFEYGEQALNYVRSICDQGICGLIIIDSTAALIPRAELEGNLEDSRPGVQAAMMSKSVKQIMDSSSKTNTTVVWINQIREKLNMGGKAMWGDSETTPGGRALKFYAHMRMRVVRIGRVYGPAQGSEEKKPVVATKSMVKVIKNKVAAPFGEGTFEISLVAGSDHPVVQLVQKAYDLKAISRKNIDGTMMFVFGKGKAAINTNCSDFVTCAAWVIKEDKISDLLDATQEKAASKDETIPDELLKIPMIEKLSYPVGYDSNVIGDINELSEQSIPEDPNPNGSPPENDKDDKDEENQDGDF